jgi:RES domain
MLRANDLKGVPELDGRQWQIWGSVIEETAIADLGSWSKLDRSGLDLDAVVASDYLYCWALRADLEAAGFRGLLVPSAAHHGNQTNLILFGTRSNVSATLPGPNPRPDYFIEVSECGDPQEPPVECLGLARYKSVELHRGLEVWRAARA